MLIALMEHPAFGTTDLSCSKRSTRWVALPEQPLRGEGTGRHSRSCGQTETSPVLNMTHPDDTIEDKPHIGPPMPCMEIRIVDPETGDAASRGDG